MRVKQFKKKHQQKKHIPKITINGWYQPLRTGWFMTVFYPTRG